MEYFDQTPGKGIKEKNMYIMHLDTPRIIILCSVVIGIIIISFLLGMNLTKTGDKSDGMLGHKDTLGDFAVTDRAPEGGIIPPAGDEGLPPAEPDLAKNPPSAVDDKSKNLSSRPDDHLAGAKSTPPADILTSENLKEVSPSMPEVKKATPVDDDSKAIKKSETKKNKRSKKQKVVEVSSGEKSLKPAETLKNQYSIQVAAFDMRSKATHEIESLKKLSYDAYMDKTQVKGKNFFRVRIGPIASKKKAIDVLNELQENNKYGESFLIKE